MWWDDHVGVQNKGKMSLKFCIIIEPAPAPDFFYIVQYTNMAPMTPCENREYSLSDLDVSGNLIGSLSWNNWAIYWWIMCDPNKAK